MIFYSIYLIFKGGYFNFFFIIRYFSNKGLGIGVGVVFFIGV